MSRLSRARFWITALALTTFAGCGGRTGSDPRASGTGATSGTEDWHQPAGTGGRGQSGGNGGSAGAPRDSSPPGAEVCDRSWLAREDLNLDSSCTSTPVPLQRIDATCTFAASTAPMAWVGSNCALSIVSGDELYQVFVPIGGPCERISGPAWYPEPESSDITLCPCVCEYIDTYDVAIQFECGCGGPIWTG